MAGKGGQLRRLHLMDPAAVGPAPYPLVGEGDGIVEAPRLMGDAVWINRAQRFEGVPAVAWTHPIGGYLPAQKWLKDRRGRRLSFDDLRHYGRILKVLAETDRIMRSIDLTLDAPPPA